MLEVSSNIVMSQQLECNKHFFNLFAGALLLLAFTLIQADSQKDFFASITQLEDIYRNEEKLMDRILRLLDHFEEIIHEIKENTVQLKRKRDSIEDVATFLQNPINSFHFLRSIIDYLSMVNEAVFEPINGLFNDFEELELTGWPTQEDLEGAANALLRLQKTYNLNVDQMIQGKIHKHSAEPLTAMDCFIIGETALIKKFPSRAHQWFSHAFKICNTQPCDSDFKIKISEYVAYASFLQGNLNESLENIKMVLELKSDHARALNNQQYLSEEINDIPASQRTGKFMMDPLGQHDSDRHYSYACRRMVRQPNQILNQLKCRYVHYNNPYLIIGPAKEEEANLDPRIVILKDVIHDPEISEIQKLAKETLERSVTQGGISEDIRLSKVAWLARNHNGTTLVDTLVRRFGVYSNLSYISAEPLQVVNYGLGGHYIPHLDAFDTEQSKKSWGANGNRIATFLLYMNTVDEGGHTVFPGQGVVVRPEKGSAVLWYNLNRNGTQDSRTLHAACPVLVGTKWAANLWFHEKYNT